MNALIDLQIACDNPLPVEENMLMTWVMMTLQEQNALAELTLRLTTREEITELNRTYRQQDKPTNVLAFPSSIPKSIILEQPFLGDVVICPQVLQQEALEQQVPLEAHWAHIIIHGVLHLLGFDHLQDDDTAMMQDKEIKILAKLGFTNPYCEEKKQIE